MTVEGCKLLCLMMCPDRASALEQWVEADELHDNEREALQKEMEENAKRLHKRRQLPRDVYRTIQKRSQQALREMAKKKHQ